MFKKLLGALGIVALGCSTAFSSVAVDSTNFPDATFRSYVSTNFDANSDGTLSDAELSRATTIDIQGMGTMNLAGIENLTALKRLWCNYAITSSGSYVLKPLLLSGRTLDSLEFRTRGTPAIEVHVEP